MLKELHLLDWPEHRHVTSIYFGGGTPSLFPPAWIHRFLETLDRRLSISRETEISLEANPGTLSARHLAGYRQAGVNRLSIGVQSFRDDELNVLTRIHSSEEARHYCLQARETGFDNISLDLIFAIPGQSSSSWSYSLDQALAFTPEHLSTYCLTLEPGTPLYQSVQRGEIEPATEDLEVDLYNLTMQVLVEHGYEQYELSNFCRPGRYSRHNQAYWDLTPYIGIGPSAHSFIHGHRRWTVSSVHDYCKQLEADRLPVAGTEHLTLEQMATETVMLGLRQKRGLDCVRFERETGLDFLAQTEDIWSHWGGIDRGTPAFSLSDTGRYLTQQGGYLALTRQGVLLYDEICTRLVAALPAG
jgi:oxygen-independent coproporphyrinogen-3 oxidase